MPTTNEVLDQHLKCFGENHLDGVLVRRVGHDDRRDPSSCGRRMTKTLEEA